MRKQRPDGVTRGWGRWMTPEDRFWVRVKKGDGCWEWQGRSVDGGGYGKLRVNKRVIGAHRFSYQLAHGPIPDGLFVCHHCDNPKCVRPDHLFLGTITDNLRDCYVKGRHGHGEARGEENWCAKLTWADVAEIRKVWAASPHPARARNAAGSCSALGRRFGVSRTAILRVVHGDGWKHEKAA